MFDFAFFSFSHAIISYCNQAFGVRSVLDSFPNCVHCSDHTKLLAPKCAIFWIFLFSFFKKTIYWDNQIHKVFSEYGPRHDGLDRAETAYDLFQFNFCFPKIFYRLERYMFPRVYGDELGDSQNFVSTLVTYLVMISVNHRIWR